MLNLSVTPLNINPYLLILVSTWTLVWKGFSLWRASKNDQKYWFIALLLINTVGILDIIFLTFFQKVNGRRIKLNKNTLLSIKPLLSKKSHRN